MCVNFRVCKTNTDKRVTTRATRSRWPIQRLVRRSRPWFWPSRCSPRGSRRAARSAWIPSRCSGPS